MEQKEPIKYMDLSEFREQGYLQEVNRLFFHPIGLALHIEQAHDGKVSLKGIADHRGDKEVITFGINNATESELAEYVRKCEYVEKEFERQSEKRIAQIGVIYEGTEGVLG